MRHPEKIIEKMVERDKLQLMKLLIKGIVVNYDTIEITWSKVALSLLTSNLLAQTQDHTTIIDYPFKRNKGALILSLPEDIAQNVNYSTYAVEVMVKDNTVVLGGEIKGNVDLSNLEEFVKNALREIGYDELYADRWGNYAIDVRRLNIINLIGKQSSEITQGVATGWGDQGVFVGYACKGDGLISKEQYLARLLNNALYIKARASRNLGIDIKTQITLNNYGHIETAVVARMVAIGQVEC